MPGLRAYLAFVVAPYATVLLFTFHEADEDLWGRMAAGRLAAASGSVPRADVFAYVPTKPLWVDHEWLSGRIFYEVHRLFGGAGLVLLRALVGLAAVALASAVGSRRGGHPAWVVIVALASLALFLQGVNGVVRAQVFSFAFFALFLAILETGGAALYALPFALAIWANLHSGFVLGLGLIGLYALDAALVRDFRRALSLAVLLVLGLASSLLNPYGAAYWSYLADALTMARPEIVEWRPAAVSGFQDLHLALGAALVLLAVVLGGRRRFAHLAVLGGVLVASLAHVRFAPFLGLAATALLPASVASAIERARTSFPAKLLPSVGAVALMSLLQALVLVGAFVAFRHRDLELRLRVPADRYPVAAVERLRAERASGRLAVFFNWGEYALHELHPRIRVSIDGRYETVYPEDVVRVNWDFTRGRAGGERLLERYGADYALYPIRSGAAEYLRSAPEWRLVYQDGASALFEKVRGAEKEAKPIRDPKER